MAADGTWSNSNSMTLHPAAEQQHGLHAQQECVPSSALGHVLTVLLQDLPQRPCCYQPTTLEQIQQLQQKASQLWQQLQQLQMVSSMLPAPMPITGSCTSQQQQQQCLTDAQQIPALLMHVLKVAVLLCLLSQYQSFVSSTSRRMSCWSRLTD